MAYMLLINLHYLIKDVAFIEEAELRILQIVTEYKTLENDSVMKKIYKNYLPLIEKDESSGDINSHVREIILGNKVKEVHWEKARLNIDFEKKGIGIKTSGSKLPLR